MAHRAALVVTVIVISGVAGAARAVDRTPALTIRLEDRTHLVDRTLADAENVARGVYRRAGVSIEWVREPAVSDAALTIVIVAAAAQSGIHVSEDSMAVTPNLDGTRARIAYVFLDRVRDFSDSARVDLWMVLGCVMAHELGHLLLPINAHSADGVMRGHWGLGFIRHAGAGVLNFSGEQARLLRARLATRERTSSPESRVPNPDSPGTPSVS
jgi:hypothetical protein